MEELSPNSFKVHHKPDIEVKNELFNLAIAENNSIETLQKETVNLEGIFKELTTKK